ncbi:MAG: DUF3891 family protein [Solirubrobacterales bacterium]|nr:DUF3891 family protein [Solirubrobacterales bacterium]MBV9424501.1 DUF3891 family protein [Solirubrobacterales bacterium]MBV9800181.1 DUF3891 family protein [Solirubrobacterales bacterium]
MLLRRDERGVIAIGQPSHAWLSGQLARAWGNDEFGRVEPYEEVCLGAEQHDIGMAAWDLEPTLNPETGLPHSFLEMPLHTHLELWTAGPRRLLRQSRYAALLASIHGRRLYAKRDLNEMAPPDADAVREFLEVRRRFEEQLLASLRADPATAPAAAEELVARNGQLVSTWDFMSLALCLDYPPLTIPDVPTATDRVPLTLTPGRQHHQVHLEPWPFASPSLTVRCEGQRLSGPYASAGELRDALTAAPWETVELELVPSQFRGTAGSPAAAR